jgi:hypothetical protein
MKRSKRERKKKKRKEGKEEKNIKRPGGTFRPNSETSPQPSNQNRTGILSFLSLPLTCGP